MIRYRHRLSHIGISSEKVSYRKFTNPPRSFRQALEVMSLPPEFTKVAEHHVDERWTEECQGIAWDGSRWIATSNRSPKAIYLFDEVNAPRHPSNLLDFASLPSPPSGNLHHIGAVIFHSGRIYVDHWSSGGQEIAVLKRHNNGFEFLHWIPLESVANKRVGLVAIDPWSEMFYTSFGSTNVDRLFIHNNEGSYTGRKILLRPGIRNGGYVQGGAFSSTGHLYIASGKTSIGDRQHIYCYCPLNGHKMREIEVITEGFLQELEGLCWAEVTRNNRLAQLHVILLENRWPARDNIYLKSFATI